MNISRNSAAARRSRSLSSARVSAASTFSVNSCARICRADHVLVRFAEVVGGLTGGLVESRALDHRRAEPRFGGPQRQLGLLAFALIDSALDDVLDVSVGMRTARQKPPSTRVGSPATSNG
jgi:hypothetical protein